ncbi:ras GEF, partial [Rhodotorula sp. JG-1b]
ERDWDDECLSFTVDHTIRGGTLKGLVIAATSHEGRVDSSYLSAFLMTYRTYCTPHQLLDELINRYRVVEPADVSPDERKEWEAKKQRPIRARVTNLLKAWVREYMDHEDLDRDLLNRIRDFALSSMTEKGQALQICKSVDERVSRSTSAARRPIGNLAPGPLPAPIVPRNLKKFKLVDIDTLEIARQLTIMDSRLFQRITAQECLSKAWPKQFNSDATNISTMIDMSNAVTRWVTETILSQDDLKKRVAIVKHFVSIAERCLSLNNFSTLIHILAGLNSTPVHRLRRTWEIVSQKTMTTLAMLNRVMRPDKNYKEYREILRKSAPPCVPFLGVYLTDWTFIGDGNPDMLRERPHQINFNKRQKASELILMIKLHQATTYNLQAVPPIATFLQDSLFPPGVDTANVDQRLYDKSFRVEPRERDDEKIARLLSESGFL